MKHPEYGWFQPHETRCKCGCGGDIQPLLRVYLNELRDAFGHPIQIVSGFRCKDYNKKVGGAKGSYHTKGKAADLRLPERRVLTHKLIKETFKINQFLGRGFYKTFIHVDIRQTAAYWVG